MQAELNVLDKATGKYFPVYGDPVSGGIALGSPATGINIKNAYHTNDVDEVSSSLTYVGTTASDDSWIINKITVSGVVTSIRYASGTTGYSTNWTNRASLTYIL